MRTAILCNTCGTIHYEDDKPHICTRRLKQPVPGFWNFTYPQQQYPQAKKADRKVDVTNRDFYNDSSAHLD